MSYGQVMWCVELTKLPEADRTAAELSYEQKAGEVLMEKSYAQQILFCGWLVLRKTGCLFFWLRTLVAAATSRRDGCPGHLVMLVSSYLDFMVE